MTNGAKHAGMTAFRGINPRCKKTNRTLLRFSKELKNNSRALFLTGLIFNSNETIRIQMFTPSIFGLI